MLGGLRTFCGRKYPSVKTGSELSEDFIPGLPITMSLCCFVLFFHFFPLISMIGQIASIPDNARTGKASSEKPAVLTA